MNRKQEGAAPCQTQMEFVILRQTFGGSKKFENNFIQFFSPFDLNLKIICFTLFWKA